MEKVDFITLANIIFKQKFKSDYKSLKDEDKENNFFILNRKFAFKYLKQAQFFNSKSIDRVNAIDVWFKVFSKSINTPDWWWKTNAPKKPKKEFSGPDMKLVKEYYGMTNKDLTFLSAYYKDELKKDIKRLKKFQK